MVFPFWNSSPPLVLPAYSKKVLLKDDRIFSASGQCLKILSAGLQQLYSAKKIPGSSDPPAMLRPHGCSSDQYIKHLPSAEIVDRNVTLHSIPVLNESEKWSVPGLGTIGLWLNTDVPSLPS